MQGILSDLYIAFNPAAEIKQPGWLIDLGGSRSELTQEEKIIQGSMIRRLLETYLSDSDFRILRLSFSNSRDFMYAQVDLSAIRPLVMKQSRIYICSDKFIDACCLSEIWQISILPEAFKNVRPELFFRRKRKIREAVKNLKHAAIVNAEIILSENKKNICSVL